MTAIIHPMPNILIVPKKQLGIDNIKLSFAFLLDVTNKGVVLVQNFKWPSSFPKLLDFGFTLANAQGMKPIFQKALEEFRDLDSEESQQVSDYIKVHFDISNDELEKMIEDGIELLPELYATVQQNIAMYNKVQAYLDRFKKSDQLGPVVTIKKPQSKVA